MRGSGIHFLMWVEAIFSREDLQQLLTELLPTRVAFGENEDGWLELYDLGDVALVPNAGLRIACKAKLRWQIAGITLPISLQALTVLLRPTIAKQAAGDALALGVEIEHADLVNVPEFIDQKITDRVNRELAAKQIDWDFTTALSRVIAVPAGVDPIKAVDLKVAWGKIRIDENALVVALSFHAQLLRETPPLLSASKPRTLMAPRPNSNAWLFAAGVAFVSGALISAAWANRHE